LPSSRTDIISVGTSPSIVPFEAATAQATGIAGGKGASLARMAGAGLPVPRGFVVGAAAFRAFLDRHGGADLIVRATEGLDVHDGPALEAASRRLREAILASALAADVEEAIGRAYRALGADCPVAVRSSAVSEDGDTASFAGQQETYLNVSGEEAIGRAVQACWASFFAPRALFYRAQKGALSDTRMAVVVQEMVLADRSGVMFTVDPIRKRRDCMVIEAVFGLGEGVVSGEITPDHYVLEREGGTLLDAFVAVQTSAIVHDTANGGTRRVELTEETGGARVLDDRQLEAVRRMGLRVEQFFGSPQDVEWCFRGDELLLLQSRPITTL
jgi:pyruvate,water dikinase